MLELVISVLLQLSVVLSGGQPGTVSQKTTVQKNPTNQVSVSTSSRLSSPASIGSTGWDDKD